MATKDRWHNGLPEDRKREPETVADLTPERLAELRELSRRTIREAGWMYGLSPEFDWDVYHEFGQAITPDLILALIERGDTNG